MFLLWAGMITMTMALLIAGYEQSQIERAIGGSDWMAYFAAQSHRWFTQAMVWRQVGGWMFALGFVLLVWDLMTIGKRETRSTYVIEPEIAKAAV
jgi:nitric oxide reductase subunit B